MNSHGRNPWKKQNVNANPEWGSIYKCVILNPIRGSDYFVQTPRVTPAVIHIESLQDSKIHF